MRRIILMTVAIGSLAWSQSMLESAAIAGTSTVGSVAGKQVSNGISKIMDKTAKKTEVAAKGGKQEVPAPPPLLKVGAGEPRQVPYNVPPPPPLAQTRKVAPAHEPEPVVEEIVQVSPAYPPAPPPPVMTAASLATVSQGMRRNEVWDKGRNAVRIMKTENGHVEEILHYRDGDVPLGVVRIVDGRVASVDVHP